MKRWTPGELESLAPILDAILDREAALVVERMVHAGFLPADHGLDAQMLFDWVSAPYAPYLDDEFTFSREWLGRMLAGMIDISGDRAAVVSKINMPASFVILDRVVWGVSALLSKLGASGPYRGILAEYRKGAPPVTELGRQEAAWRAARSTASG